MLQPCAWALWLKLGQGKKEMGQKKTKERKKIEHIKGIKNNHFNVILMMRSRVYYKEEGGGFLPNPWFKVVYVICLWDACVYVILS